MNQDLPTLEMGSTDPNVKILQDKLKILDFYAPSVTGSFGEATRLGVIAFQEAFGLNPTGIVDNNTWKSLYEYTAPSYPVQTTTFSIKPTIRLGSTGQYVTELQTQLKQILYYSGAITGNFDTTTEKAVKEFQSNNKLTADGIVGRDTWSALTYLYSPLAICGGDEPKNDEYYTVQAGDTLWSIANRYGLSVDKLKTLNNLTSNTISIGQQLIVSSSLPNSNQYYTVQAGDTLWSIANRYGLSVDELKNLNNLTSNTISIGQQLIVSGSTPQYTTYIVKAGDTLWGIANRYGVTVDRLIQINNLSSNILSIGQQLIIPS